MKNAKKAASILIQESSEGMKSNSKVQIDKLEQKNLRDKTYPHEDKREQEIEKEEQKVIDHETEMADAVEVQDIKHDGKGSKSERKENSDTINAKDLAIDKNDRYATAGKAAEVLNKKMDSIVGKNYQFEPNVEPSDNWKTRNERMDKLAKEPYKDTTIYSK